MSTQAALAIKEPIIDFETRTEIQEASIIFEKSLEQLKYDIEKLTDHSLSGHLTDVYLDEAKYCLDTAIHAREEIKKGQKKLESERI